MMPSCNIGRARDAAAGEFRRGWPVVLACFCTAMFAWGFGFYGQSVYFADLAADCTAGRPR